MSITPLSIQTWPCRRHLHRHASPRPGRLSSTLRAKVRRKASSASSSQYDDGYGRDYRAVSPRFFHFFFNCSQRGGGGESHKKMKAVQSREVPTISCCLAGLTDDERREHGWTLLFFSSPLLVQSLLCRPFPSSFHFPLACEEGKGGSLLEADENAIWNVLKTKVKVHEEGDVPWSFHLSLLFLLLPGLFLSYSNRQTRLTSPTCDYTIHGQTRTASIPGRFVICAAYLDVHIHTHQTR